MTRSLSGAMLRVKRVARRAQVPAGRLTLTEARGKIDRLRGGWGCSSDGRALDWQSRGSGFDPHQLHHFYFGAAAKFEAPLRHATAAFRA